MALFLACFPGATPAQNPQVRKQGGSRYFHYFQWDTWWSCGESNPGPLQCDCSALPSELQPRPDAVTTRRTPLPFEINLLSAFCLCCPSDLTYLKMVHQPPDSVRHCDASVTSVTAYAPEKGSRRTLFYKVFSVSGSDADASKEP
jgi:hypothetical protein